MTKPVVDDAMVTRFVDKFYVVPTNCDVEQFCKIRRALEAALTEPEEIPVTREMADAGGEAWRKCRETERQASLGYCGAVGWSTNEFAKRIYRVMESVRRESEKAKPIFVPFLSHRRHDDPPMQPAVPHRRKDDPR